MFRILVVDDEPKLGALVAEALESPETTLSRAQGGRAALKLMEGGPFDVVVTDLRMPDVDGMAVLQAARAQGAEVILMTAHGSTENAVAAMKAGAADYLTKPFSMDELRIRVKRLTAQKAANTKAQELLHRLTPTLVGESPGMKQVLSAARQVAQTDATVLLLGESGTGKNQLARYIHYQSKRSAAAWAEVHCAALPEALLESELFGHEKGAFTGAHEKKHGHLASADQGTLFLDEIGDVTSATQVKLLRFLQSREFVPVGATEAKKVDVRVIAATNRDLSTAVKEGRFREDFLYRLNVFAIDVPPLRSRREDIIPLVEHFLAERSVPLSKLSPKGRERILAHDWPGNARELENALERALILAAEDEILPEHISTRRFTGGSSQSPGELLGEGFALDTFELSLLHAAIERAGGNKTAAAKLLGITRRRLYSRLKALSEPEVDEGGP
jgi:two-component system response regulator HydG